MSPFTPIDVSSLSKHVHRKVNAVGPRTEVFPAGNPVRLLAEYGDHQYGLLTELCSGAGCILFSMGVVVGAYLLLDSL
jgi:hypothetical protein